MASGTSASASVVRQLSSLFETGSVAGLSDRQLLDRFIVQRDAAGEAAFTALVTRHGPMVLNVCSDILLDRHHAEDAFQAVFLILAQKARSIRDPRLAGKLALRCRAPHISLHQASARSHSPARGTRLDGPRQLDNALSVTGPVNSRISSHSDSPQLCCTLKSSGYRARSGCRSFCGTSRGSPFRTRPGGCVALMAPFAAGWPGGVRN